MLLSAGRQAGGHRPASSSARSLAAQVVRSIAAPYLRVRGTSRIRCSVAKSPLSPQTNGNENAYIAGPFGSGRVSMDEEDGAVCL